MRHTSGSSPARLLSSLSSILSCVRLVTALSMSRLPSLFLPNCSFFNLRRQAQHKRWYCGYECCLLGVRRQTGKDAAATQTRQLVAQDGCAARTRTQGCAHLLTHVMPCTQLSPCQPSQPLNAAYPVVLHTQLLKRRASLKTL